MMNFPASPAMNQQYSSGTTTWQWDGVTWNIVPQPGPMAIGDLPPPNPAIGQQWLRTTNMQLYAWYVDPTSSQWIQVSGPGPAPGIWEPLFSGAVTSITLWPKVDLDAYAQLRLGVDIAPDSAAGSFTLRFSEDNGATWLSGANYTMQIVAGTIGTNANGQMQNVTGLDMGAGKLILPTASSGGLGMEWVFKRFNKPGWTRWQGYGGMYTSTPELFGMVHYGVLTRGNPCNGIRIQASQPFSGFITLEGIRG